MNDKLLFANALGDKDAVTKVNLEEVHSIFVRVVTGDEIVIVTFKDGTVKYYDIGECQRSENLYDGEYYIYLPSRGINIIDEFNEEKTAYDILYQE